MDRIADIAQDRADDKASETEASEPVTYDREWSNQHPINLRTSIPLPFGRWYVTLVAGPERRSKDRLSSERKKHPLDTVPNVTFLLLVGMISTAVLFSITAFTLIHGFGWSIQITLPS